MGQPPSRSRTLGSAAVLAVSLATVLAACGGGGPTKASASGTATTIGGGASGSSSSSAGGARRAGSPPGVAGSVAAISGSSMEVQNPSSGQTTVDWTASTTFDQTVTLTATSLAAGDCVTVVGPSSGGTITARSVTIATASPSATCNTGLGGGAGRGRFPGGARRTGRPTGSVPSGGNPGRFANIGFAGGKVVSSSTSKLVIFGTSFSGLRSRTATSSPPTTAAPADVTVMLTASTTFSQVRPATAGNLAVGDCVAASGPADSTGAVSARTIRITSTGGRSCTTGFGPFGGGASGASAAATSNAANG